MKTAFLFPGQGAQRVGMGKDLYQALHVARDVFDRAERTTRLPLKKLCFEGPAEELARTDVCQAAILTVSVATLEAMKELMDPEHLQAIRPARMAGLSLGEYTALYAAGAMDLETALRLVTKRGALMQKAATAVPSAMVSLLGVDENGAAKLCEDAGQGQVLTCAGFNCPGQIVVSGQVEACERALGMAKDYGASGAVALAVAGGFHSELMKPAADGLAEAMADVPFRLPDPPVIANVDATAYKDADQISTKLLAQLVSPVRWQRSVEAMLALEIDEFYEIGPGRVLAGLMRRIRRRTNFTCINGLEAVEKLAKGR